MSLWRTCSSRITARAPSRGRRSAPPGGFLSRVPTGLELELTKETTTVALNATIGSEKGRRVLKFGTTKEPRFDVRLADAGEVLAKL